MATVVGVPKEIKDMEGRVSMQPDGVAELVHHGYEVVVQGGAGAGAGFTDEEYAGAGARLVDGPDTAKGPEPGGWHRAATMSAWVCHGGGSP